jgi:hypothetical protein
MKIWSRIVSVDAYGATWALVRAEEGARAQSKAELRRGFWDSPTSVCPATSRRVTSAEATKAGWLTWDAFASRVAGMAKLIR